MRFLALYRFMIVQMWNGPGIRAFLIVYACGLLWLVVMRTLPTGEMLGRICAVFLPVYFTCVTAGNIIEKTDRSMIELMLAKPFSRSDVILADYLSVLSIYGAAAFMTALGLWCVFGLRLNDWGFGFVAVCFSLVVSFGYLYSYIILTGLLIRSAGVVIVVWVGYLYFGMALLEAGATWISKNGTGLLKIGFYGVYFLFPRTLGVYRSVRDIVLGPGWDMGSVVTSGILSVLVLIGAMVHLNRRDIH